jgi:NitT/TauT family transport system substrate-binding protein
MAKKISRTWIAVLGVVLVAAAAVYMVQAPKESGDVQLKVGVLRLTTVAPTFIALENGYFADEGLNVSKVEFQTSNQLAEAVANGQVDFSGDMSASVVFAIEQRSPGSLKIYSTDIHAADSPLASVIVRNDSSLTVNDLDGKKIAVFPGSTAAMLSKLSFKNILGRDLEAEYVQMAPNLWLQSLESGQVDAVVAYEPFGTLAKDTGVGKEIYTGLFENNIFPDIKRYPPGAMIVSPKLVRDRPDVVEKIVRATQKGADFWETNKGEARIILTKHTPISESVAKSLRMQEWAIGPRMDVELSQRYADLLLQEGELQQKIDVSKIVYTAT